MTGDEPAPEPPLLSELSAGEIWQRALTYRSMAQVATTAEQRNSLLRLAWRYEKLAMAKQPGC